MWFLWPFKNSKDQTCMYSQGSNNEWVLQWSCSLGKVWACLKQNASAGRLTASVLLALRAQLTFCFNRMQLWVSDTQCHSRRISVGWTSTAQLLLESSRCCAEVLLIPFLLHHWQQTAHMHDYTQINAINMSCTLTYTSDGIEASHDVAVFLPETALVPHVTSLQT